VGFDYWKQYVFPKWNGFTSTYKHSLKHQLSSKPLQETPYVALNRGLKVDTSVLQKGFAAFFVIYYSTYDRPRPGTSVANQAY
jgi:hypothetical protein